MLEGDDSGQLVRVDHPVVRVRELDAHTREPVRESTIAFRARQLPLGPGQAQASLARPTALPQGHLRPLRRAAAGGQSEVLTSPDDPFQLVVKAYLPASMPAVEHVADPDGVPMARIHAQFKGPGRPSTRDLRRGERRALVQAREAALPDRQGRRPRLFAFTYADRPELVEDFLAPPKGTGAEGVARFRYRDKSGKERNYDWPLEGQAGKSITLPDSDLTATFVKVAQIPTSGTGLARMLGEPSIPVAHFQVRQGDGPEVDHYGWASLPMVPNVIPTGGTEGEPPKSAPGGVDYSPPRPRSQDERPVRPGRGDGDPRRLDLLSRLRPGQGGDERDPIVGPRQARRGDHRVRRQPGTCR